MTIRDAVVEGLTAPVTDAERERVLRELESRLPADGDGPLVIERIRATPRPYRHTVRLLGRRGSFRFADAACALLAVGALDDADVDALEPLLPSSCAIRRQQVLNRLAVDDVAGARVAADRIADGYSWTGHRDIAAVFADRGDARGFFAGWKSYAAGKDRHEMVELKARLVVGVARVAGWRAAVAVTGDKRIGPDFAWHAFGAFGPDVAGLRGVLAGEAAGILPELDELRVLADAVRAASGKDPRRNHPFLDELVDRIIAVDPTVDRDTMRTRDFLLFSLWPAMGDQATLDRVRKAVRTPHYKRELTTLPRDLTAQLNR